MRLKLPQLKLSDQLQEFDHWVTQSLGEIKDTARFSSERTAICNAIETLGIDTHQFASLDETTPNNLAKSVLGSVSGKKESVAVPSIRGVFAFFFVVTGKSDNNCKCQFPLFLRDTLLWQTYPKVLKKDRKKSLVQDALPRILDDEGIAKTVYALEAFPREQERLLSSYISFLLDGDDYHKAFWAIGSTYFHLKETGLHENFLLPLVVYRVRGSVSASGGHEPETLLRKRMLEWGLSAGSDFNTADVIVGKQKQGKETKTRAYDFVLPYNLAGWERRLFIQCQFYAGDSGSVSHKNVDQTRASRDFTKKHYADPLFLEYVDGAGYFASLNSDLQHILKMRDTNGFFQVRTAPIKLRAALQDIGFLTPLEVIHAWSLRAGDKTALRQSLEADDYSISEIDRVISEGVQRGVFFDDANGFTIDISLREMARRYLLLDFIAIIGKRFKSGQVKGTLLVPGFGQNFGISLSELVDNVLPKAGLFGQEWAKNGQVLKDIEFLAKRGWIEQR